jgi:radical SAM superfamily enzyme YgiQ (UPF0313 family)
MILLIFPNPSPFPYHAMTPLAIFTVGTYLEKHGIEVEYYDERVQSREELEAVLARKPELIGVSSLTSFQIIRGIALTRMVKKRLPETPVVWGGVHPSMCPEQTLSEPDIDYVVVREGEETTRELYRYLKTGSPSLDSIAGLAWKDSGGKIHLNPDRPFVDVEYLPFPYQGKAGELLPRYLRPEASFPTVGYQMSRGCYFNCRFCYNVFYHKRKCRRKSPAAIRRELERLVALGVDNIFFYDDSMGGQKEFLEEMVPVLEGFSLKWSASPRINCIDEKIIRDFERIGCQWLFFGLESPLDHMLKYIGKGVTRAEADRGVEIMKRSSIISTYSLMIGFPRETYADALAVLDYADELHRIHPAAEIVIQPYAPLPGTDLFEEAKRKGFQPPARLRDWSYFTMDRIHTPWLKGRPLFKNVYLISFLAFRYEHMLGDLDKYRWAYAIAHYLAALRWRRRWFGFYLEGWFYRLYTSWHYWRAGR